MIPQTARIPSATKMFRLRLGLAYDVSGKGETVVRLSAGLFDARTPVAPATARFGGLRQLQLGIRFVF